MADEDPVNKRRPQYPFNDPDPIPLNPVDDLSKSEQVEEAIKAFLAGNFQPEEEIGKAWFYKALSVPFPMDGMPHDEANRLELRFLSLFNPLRTRLLREHNIALATNYGGSYYIKPPSEQAAWAEAELNKELRSSFRKARDRAHFVDTSGLTHAQRNERRAVLSDIGKRSTAAGSKLRRDRRYRDVSGDEAPADKPGT